MKVFISAPFFNYAERELNKKIAEFLRKLEFVKNVFLPQEYGLLETSDDDAKRKIFDLDLNALKDSDVIVAILDGECLDSGMCFELGYAYALGKPIIGIKTDYRVFSRIEELNLMIEKSLYKLIVSQNLEDIKAELVKTLEELKGKIS